MAEGGFFIKFDGKEVVRCYKVAFSYDEWSWTKNFDAPQSLPDKLKTIEVKLETGGENNR